MNLLLLYAMFEEGDPVINQVLHKLKPPHVYIYSCCIILYYFEKKLPYSRTIW